MPVLALPECARPSLSSFGGEGWGEEAPNDRFALGAPKPGRMVSEKGRASLLHHLADWRINLLGVRAE